MLISNFGRFIICTPRQAGLLGEQREHHQNKKDLQLNFETKNSNNNLITQIIQTHLWWVGVFVIIFLFGGSLNISSAKAANSIDDNLARAKRVIENVAPVVSDSQFDQDSNPLTFAPEGFLSKPLVAETVITSKQNLVKPVSLPKLTFSNKAEGNHFAYGYCTYYVASRRQIPWFGNAGTWLAGAIKYGFATGRVPRVGAIIVTSESRWGHVGIVEAVDGGQITIAEMNYRGWAKVTTRTISAAFVAINGYIY